MNDRGEIAGYAAPEPYHPLSVPVRVDEAGALAPLAAPGESFNFAFGIDPGGTLLVGQSGLQAFAWKDGAGSFLLTTAGTFSGMARDVNAAGLIAGSVGDSDQIGPRHVVWPDRFSEPVILEGVFPGNSAGTAFAVNGSDQVAGVSGGISGAFVAAYWEDILSPPLQIGPLPDAFNSEARDLNELGDVVGRSSFEDFTTEAFLWRREKATLTGLGFLPGGEGYSEAFGVNDLAHVVGTARAAEGRVHAFIWIEGVMYDLNDFAAVCDPRLRYLSAAVAVNTAGQIAAEAVVAEDDQDVPRWIAILTPIQSATGDGSGSECDVQPGDCNADGDVNIADASCLLGFLFLGSPAALPCGDGTREDPASARLVNWSEGTGVDLSDAIGLLNWLFLGGPRHILGSECRPLPGCPAACGAG
jgi:probable HAF family extracellular repeat protein